MKAPLLLLSVSLLAGCTTVGSDRLYQVQTEYLSISKGMTRQQIVARLGKPTYMDRTGGTHWKYVRPRGDVSRYVDLVVRFDGNGRAENTFVGNGYEEYPKIDDRIMNPPPDRAYAPDWQPIAGRQQ